MDVLTPPGLSSRQGSKISLNKTHVFGVCFAFDTQIPDWHAGSRYETFVRTIRAGTEASHGG
jgi:hypothetical protein